MDRQGASDAAEGGASDQEGGPAEGAEGVSPRPSRRKVRAKREGSEDERRRLQMQIEALEKKNQQLKRVSELYYSGPGARGFQYLPKPSSRPEFHYFASPKESIPQ